MNILQNPHNFPQQISMLKKYFSDMELTIEELKDIIDRNFPELKSKVSDGDDEENSFIGLLQNLFLSCRLLVGFRKDLAILFHCSFPVTFSDLY